VISNRVRSRWPLFEIPPSLGLPPVVCWCGTRPSQAAKSRPRRKLSSGGANACSAIAVIGPTPGMVISRAASSSDRAASPSSFARPAISASRATIRSNSSVPNVRTRFGSGNSGSSRARARRLA